MNPNLQAGLAGLALLLLGILGAALIWHAVPNENRELLATIVGAIAGALTMGGAMKLMHKPDQDSPQA
jgi:hypothetical protein